MRNIANDQQPAGTQQPLDESLFRREHAALRCLVCARQCLLPEGSHGFCSAIAHRDGWLHSTAYGVIGEAAVTPIENKPVYHYRPGTRTLSLGGLGCNLRCRFCQNWELAYRSARDGGGLAAPNLPPATAVARARERGCQGIAWSHNEPSISPMYVRDTAREARAAGLYTVLVTNGWLTLRSLRFLGPWLDVYRVDIKSLDRAFYEQVAGAGDIESIIPLARAASLDYGAHVETVTNLMPGLNDSDDHLTRLADQIVSQLGPLTPWHLTTYVPYAHMRHISPTPPETLARARAIGRRAGLSFVFTDDPFDCGAADTVCPWCAARAIARGAATVDVSGVTSLGACVACGGDLGVTMSAIAFAEGGARA